MLTRYFDISIFYKAIISAKSTLPSTIQTTSFAPRTSRDTRTNFITVLTTSYLQTTSKSYDTSTRRTIGTTARQSTQYVKQSNVGTTYASTWFATTQYVINSQESSTHIEKGTLKAARNMSFTVKARTNHYYILFIVNMF